MWYWVTDKKITKFTGKQLHAVLEECCKEAEIEEFNAPELHNNDCFDCYFDHDDVTLCLANGELALYDDEKVVYRIKLTSKDYKKEDQNV